MDRLALDEDLPLVWYQRTRERLDQGRFPRPIVADDGEDLPGIELEIGAVQGGDLAIALDEPARLEDRFGCGRLMGHCCRCRANWSTVTARMTRMPVTRI